MDENSQLKKSLVDDYLEWAKDKLPIYQDPMKLPFYMCQEEADTWNRILKNDREQVSIVIDSLGGCSSDPDPVALSIGCGHIKSEAKRIVVCAGMAFNSVALLSAFYGIETVIPDVILVDTSDIDVAADRLAKATELTIQRNRRFWETFELAKRIELPSRECNRPKKKPCTSHEYMLNDNNQWQCIHCRKILDNE